MCRALFACLLALPMALAACHGGHSGDATLPGDKHDFRPYAGIAAGDTLHFAGTEPFWGGTVTGTTMLYRTAQAPDGQTMPVARFNGRGGFSYSGKLDGADLVMAITPGKCSDGMSDRTYPFVVTLRIGDALRSGCAWSDGHPFTGAAGEAPKAP